MKLKSPLSIVLGDFFTACYTMYMAVPVTTIVTRTAAEGKVTNKRTYTVTFTATGVGTTTQYKRDNGSWTTTTSPLTLTGFTAGLHTISIKSTNGSDVETAKVLHFTVTNPDDAAILSARGRLHTSQNWRP